MPGETGPQTFDQVRRDLMIRLGHEPRVHEDRQDANDDFFTGIHSLGCENRLVEILLGVAMIGGGLLLAVIVAALAVRWGGSDQAAPGRPGRDGIEASILFHIARAGGAPRERSLAIVRETRRAVVPIVEEIDLSSWAESYRTRYGPEEGRSLLEDAVKTAVLTGSPLPVAQYDALIDLTFALGFRSDTLARLRATNPFTYEDHARRGRPRSADRAGGSVPLFARTSRTDRMRLLAMLGLDREVARSELISVYRTLAARHHPDRFHDAGDDARQEAAARFIEITEAYGQLMASSEEVDEKRKV